MNLGEKRERDLRQQDRVGRRSGIIEGRRNTRAPILETNRSLRSARRGDVGGARALAETLGVVQKGITDFQGYATNQHIVDEDENKAKGAADAAAGILDPELHEKSLGYKNAITKGRTVTAFSKASREFSEGLEDVISSQTDPDLETRLGEVEGQIEEFYTNFAVDPETGQLKPDLQSPGAMRYLAEAIQTSRPKALATALERVEEKFNEEAISLFGTNIVDQAVETGTFDLEAARSLLPASVPEEDINEAVIASVSNSVEALRAEGRFAEAVALMAGLRGRTDKPIDTGLGDANPTGRSVKDNPKGPSGTPGAPPDVKLFQNPVGGRITSKYGVKRGKKSHNGVDIAVPVGTPVPAAMGGEIVRAWSADAGGTSLKVKYDDGTVVGFAHLSDNKGWKAGQRFEPGTELALTGNTGRSTGPHLHYTMARNGVKMDPLSAEPGIVSFDPGASEAQGIENASPSETTDVAPGAVLRDPFQDPVTQAEQSREITAINGLDGLKLSPQQQARVNQMYKVTTAEIRREWTAKLDEQRSENGSRLMLGMLGIGGTTTREDVMEAYQNGEIGDSEATSLVQMYDRQEDRRAAEAERLENRAERAERKARDKAIEEGGNVIIGRLIRGDLSPAQARTAVLQAASRMSPTVAASIMANVNSVASNKERLIGESAEVRAASEEFSGVVDQVGDMVGTMNIPRSKRKEAAETLEGYADAAHAEFMRRVINGEPPAAVKQDVAKKFATKRVQLERAYAPAPQ